MAKITKKETSKQVSFAWLNPNDVFYYKNRYWMKIYPATVNSIHLMNLQRLQLTSF